MKIFVKAFSVLVVLGIVSSIVWPKLARYSETRRREAARTQYLAMTRQTPEWKNEAAAFERDGKRLAAFFDNPSRVEAFNLLPIPLEGMRGTIRGYAYDRKIQITGTSLSQRLGVIVLDTNSYVELGIPRTQCYFRPGIAFRLWRNKKFVDLLICFDCGQLAVVENDPKIPLRRMGSSLEERFKICGNFIARKPLIGIARETFPTEAKFQKLR